MTTTAPVPGETPMPSAVEIARTAVRTGTRIAPSVAAELLAEYDRRGAALAYVEALVRQVAAAVPDLEAEKARLLATLTAPAGPVLDRDAEIEQRRAALCKALAIPDHTAWKDALESARSAGVVRDAEYRTRDRVDVENARLRTRLSALVPAAVEALAILDGRASGDADDWDATAERLRAALNDEEVS